MGYNKTLINGCFKHYELNNFINLLYKLLLFYWFGNHVNETLT